MFKETKTQKLWSSAQTLIPGGNMFLSKNPDRFLPNQWPAYFSKSKKCFIWDLDNKKYVDILYNKFKKKNDKEEPNQV